MRLIRLGIAPFFPIFFKFFYFYIYIFKNSFLYHCQVDTVHNYCDGKWEDPTIIPECLLSHLTTCTLRNYVHKNNELQFAKYIMQNSRVLSTMTIQCAKFLETNTKLQMSRELSLYPRISGTCQLLCIWMNKLACNSSLKLVTNLVITTITFI
jgi:hypothetical protein